VVNDDGVEELFELLLEYVVVVYDAEPVRDPGLLTVETKDGVLRDELDKLLENRELSVRFDTRELNGGTLKLRSDPNPPELELL
jgi:hypothetical protein